MRFLPAWARGYDRAWLRADVVAGLIVWSVVTPQAVAYAQIAGLPPAAGLIAAPGAMIGYALLGTSRTLVVSATTATSALSAAAVGPLAGGDPARFAALSAALALVAAALLAAAAMLKLGALTDFVSRPVMTGFLFGLGLLITLGQLPALLGVPAGDGNFFPKLADLLESLDDAQGWTVAVGAASIVALVLLRRLAPALPGTLIVLGLAIVLSAALGLEDKGVDVVGALPDAVPDPSVPDVSLAEVGALVPAAIGVMRASALGFALVALAGLLLLGVLPGLLVAALLSLGVIVRRLSRPPVNQLARDARSGAWGALDRHPDWETVPGVLVARVEGFLFYADVNGVRERIQALVARAEPPPGIVVLELDQDDVDVESLDVLAELAAGLRRDGVELRLGGVRSRVRELVGRAGLDAAVMTAQTLDEAVRAGAGGPRTGS